MIMTEILTTHIMRYSSFFEMVSIVRYLSNKPITKEDMKRKIIVKSTHLVFDFFLLRQRSSTFVNSSSLCEGLIINLQMQS